MQSEITTIPGGKHSDSRGTLEYVNGFDMSEIRRMYLIRHPDPSILRGWRGHKIEQRWFYAVSGSFEVRFVKIDDFEEPNPDLEISTYIISALEPQILHVPVGYASAFKALEKDASFLVYADTMIADADKDDYHYPIDYFNKWK